MLEHGVEGARARRELGACVGREDLLPAVVAFERREVRSLDEALGLVVEARAAVASSAAARPADARVVRAARRDLRSGRRRRCSTRRTARRRLLPRARPLRVGPRAARPGTWAAPTSPRTARRTPRRASAVARGVGPDDQFVVVGLVALRDHARVVELVERALLEADRERRHAVAGLLRRKRGERRRSRRRPRAARRPGTSLTRCARTESRNRPRSSSAARPRRRREAPSTGAGRDAHTARARRAVLRRSGCGRQAACGSGEKIVSGAGIELKARNASSASKSSSPRARQASSAFSSEAKVELAVLGAVVERLDPEAVSRQHEPRARRPRSRSRTCREASRRTPFPAPRTAWTSTSVSPSRAKSWPLRSSSRRSSRVVVDLAVLDHVDGAVLVGDRLVAALEVDDREPARGQPDPAVDRAPPSCRAPGGRARAHRAQPVGSRAPCPGRDPADPAHRSYSTDAPRRPAGRFRETSPCSDWRSTRHPVATTVRR